MKKQHKIPEFQVISHRQANKVFFTASDCIEDMEDERGDDNLDGNDMSNSFGAKSPTSNGIPNLYEGFDNKQE